MTLAARAVRRLSLAVGGTVSSASGEVYRIKGLPDLRMGSIVTIPASSARAVVVSLAPNSGAVSLRLNNVSRPVQAGDGVSLESHFPISVPSLSSVGLHPRSVPFTRRDLISAPLLTGVLPIDLLHPLAHGQRVALVGPRNSGKAGIVLDIMHNLANSGVKFVYAITGKSRTYISRVKDVIAHDPKLASMTSVVAVSHADPIGEQYLAPYTALAEARAYRDLGQRVVLILDDTSEIARTCQSVSRIIRNSWDGFLQTLSVVMDQSLQLRESAGGGSLTVLCVAHTASESASGLVEYENTAPQASILDSMTDHSVTVDEGGKVIVENVVSQMCPRYQPAVWRELARVFKQRLQQRKLSLDNFDEVSRLIMSREDQNLETQEDQDAVDGYLSLVTGSVQDQASLIVTVLGGLDAVDRIVDRSQDSPEFTNLVPLLLEYMNNSHPEVMAELNRLRDRIDMSPDAQRAIDMAVTHTVQQISK